MQAIITKILPQTETRPTRIKATSARGSLTISVPMHTHSGSEEAHMCAAQKLAERFVWQDSLVHGKECRSPWGNARVIGVLPNGDHVHVFVNREAGQ